MPAPLDASKRAAILEDITAGVKARNQIARDHAVSPSTVTKVAKDAAIEDAFDRSNLKDALQAKAVDDKALRRATSRRFLEKANELMDRMDRPHLVFAFGGRDNVYNEHLLKEAPSGDLRNYMVTAATAFDKHLAADKHDADDSTSMASVDQWLDSLTAGEGH